jgi:hypothetical protein
METNQVTEHLQVIRTLMERSALYRRALAPIMIFVGVLGIAAGIIGWQIKINSDRDFILFWSGLALLALTGSFLLVRRQALKDSEPFWSPPTRRVAQALLLPCTVVAFCNLTLIYEFFRSEYFNNQIGIIAVWAWFYASAIHSAGFFMARGIKLLAWIFVFFGCVLFAVAHLFNVKDDSPHWVMAGLFGGLHLAYGIYLYFTENRKIAP